MGIVDQVMQQATPGERIGVAVRRMAGGSRLATSLSGRYILEIPGENLAIINGVRHDRREDDIVQVATSAFFARYLIP